MGLCELVERCDWFVGGKGQKVSMAMQSTCLGGGNEIHVSRTWRYCFLNEGIVYRVS
jgi:hypothetical protein